MENQKPEEMELRVLLPKWVIKTMRKIAVDQETSLKELVRVALERNFGMEEIKQGDPNGN